MSDMNILNKVGPRTEPWRTPARICPVWERSSLILTLNMRSVRYELIRRINVGG